MNMQLVDWGIVVGLLVLLIWAAYRTKKHTRSVADFLVANRCAGRYVLGTAQAMEGIGAISVVAMLEAYYRAGFTMVWWQFLPIVMMTIVSLSGWIQYRYRQTRALTMAQFLEERYGKKFRVFAGITAWVSGILNLGIFPAVYARFFMYYCGLPSHEVSIGFATIDLTYASIMIVLLAIALFFTFIGGQIAVIVTDFIQGVFFNGVIAIVIIVLFVKFPWPQILDSILQRPLGESMIDPYDTEKLKIFNKWFFLIAAATSNFWCWMAFQGNSGYKASATNAHEARMGMALGYWRNYTAYIVIVLVAVCAYTMMHHPDWAAEAATTTKVLDTVSADPDNVIRKQVTTSVAMTQFIPIGLMGAFAAAMLAAFISTHDTYMHAWGTIFIQDVVLPLRKERLTPEQHMRLLRWSIFGVAVFIFLFSLFFGQNDAILMFFALTGLIWLGGGGTVVTLGLYWKRGSTGAAFTSVSVGILMGIFGFVIQRLWPMYHDGEPFPINSQYLYGIAVVISIVLFVTISLISGKTHDMDKLLRRGKYAVAGDKTEITSLSVPRWQRIMGINKDFTKRDKVVYLFIGSWNIIWALIFVAGSLYKAAFGISIEAWTSFWHFYIWVILLVAIGTTIWFTIGGLIDLNKMFDRLSKLVRDQTDDGEILAENEQ